MHPLDVFDDLIERDGRLGKSENSVKRWACRGREHAWIKFIFRGEYQVGQAGGHCMKIIRPALPEDAEAISALAVRSKAHWGYTAEQMSVFTRELVLSPAAVTEHRAHVIADDDGIVGFYTLLRRDDDEAELEHIFVDPTCLRRGLGAMLLRHACLVANRLAFRRLVTQSDPNAAGFYEAMGARFERLTTSSIEGRTIPVFSLDLGEGDAVQHRVAADGAAPRR
jgi:ribosomal protein S18 acetylase RimI-like enzyme